MIEIVITKGKMALIDDEDVDLARFKWHAAYDRSGGLHNWYVIRSIRIAVRKRATIRLHREVLSRVIERPLKSYEQVDHINHNGLDNRRSNLRLASRQQNQRNRRIQGTSKSSQYKGVTWDKDAGKWRAQINIGGHHKGLGRFVSEYDAARAYDVVAKQIFGPFCCLNFPD